MHAALPCHATPRARTSRSQHLACLLLASLAAVASTQLQLASAAPWDLNSYRLCTFTKLEGISDNASGAAYMPEDQSLWVIVNNPPSLWQYHAYTRRLLQRIDIKWVNDPEGIARMGPGLLAVVEEPNSGGGIRVLDVSQRGYAKLQRTIPLPIRRWPGAGMEGLTYDPNTDTFYVGQEKGPRRVWAVSGKGGEPKMVVDADKYAIGDVAELYFSPHAPQPGQLYVLSQESSRVLRVNLPDGRIIQELPVKGRWPEGLTFTPGGDVMWVVGEPNELAEYRTGSCPV